MRTSTIQESIEFLTEILEPKNMMPDCKFQDWELNENGNSHSELTEMAGDWVSECKSEIAATKDSYRKYYESV